MEQLTDLDVRLETERLVLCPWRPQDFETYHRWLNSPDVARVLPVPSPLSEQDARAVFEQILALPADHGVQLTVWRKQPLQLIGMIGIAGIDARDRHGALIAALPAPGARGHGYAREAARAVMAYAFGELELRKLWLNHHGFNTAAHAAAESLGFVEVGRQRDHCFIDGAWTDWVTMELFAS